MISLYIRIRTDPLISYLNVPTPFTHPSQKIPGKFCVRFLAPAVFHRFFQSRSHILGTAKDSRRPADRNTRKPLAVFCRVIPYDKGTHAMSEEEIWKPRIFLTYKFLKLMLILHHGMESFVSPVAPGIILHSRLAMPYMVIRRYDIACVHELHDHMEIPSGMLSETVYHLYDSLRLCGRNIYPGMYLIPLVE